MQGLPAPDSMNDADAAAIVGAARGLESLARTVRARKLPPLGARTWDLLRWAATAQRPAADPRSAMTRRLAMAALVTGNQATASVIERGLLDADAEVRRFAAVAAATDAPIAERDALLKRALADKDAARSARGAARLGPAACRRRRARRSAPRSRTPTRTCGCRRSICSATAVRPAEATVSRRCAARRRCDASAEPRDVARAGARDGRRWRAVAPDDARKALPRFVAAPDLAGADVRGARRGRARRRSTCSTALGARRQRQRPRGGAGGADRPEAARGGRPWRSTR